MKHLFNLGTFLIRNRHLLMEALDILSALVQTWESPAAVSVGEGQASAPPRREKAQKRKVDRATNFVSGQAKRR